MPRLRKKVSVIYKNPSLESSRDQFGGDDDYLFRTSGESRYSFIHSQSMASLLKRFACDLQYCIHRFQLAEHISLDIWVRDMKTGFNLKKTIMTKGISDAKIH